MFEKILYYAGITAIKLFPKILDSIVEHFKNKKSCPTNHQKKSEAKPKAPIQ